MSEGRILVLLAIAAAPVAAQQRPCDPPTPLGPSHDLYCIELVPAPGLVGISGRVELGVPPGPFAVAVTPDGRSRYVPIVSLHGLPPQASLVKATPAAFVAWVGPPQIDTVIKLGDVRNGSTALRAVDLDKFVVLITAERDRRAREPTGRVVLRGQSPSTRLFPPDLLEFSIGAMGQSPGMSQHEHRDRDTARDSLEWPMVPMPRGLTMLPAELALRPHVSPYWPAGTPPVARPREQIRLADGDPLRVEAGLERRRRIWSRQSGTGADARRPPRRRCRTDPPRPGVPDPRAHGSVRQSVSRERRARLPTRGAARRGDPLLPDQRLEHTHHERVVPGCAHEGRGIRRRYVRARGVGGERGDRPG